MNEAITEVVAALLWENNRFLICQRPAHKTRGLLWEFAGGKVEPGETGPEALIRECQEELAVTLQVGDVFMALTYAYPDLTVHLALFNAKIVGGRLTPLEHAALQWISPEEIGNYAFCPADWEILETLGRVHSPVQAQLFSHQDREYRRFHCRLMPGVPEEKVIGVRIPQLRKIAREMALEGTAPAFLASLPHRYYEEDNLHGLLLSRERSYSETVAQLDRFLPYVDNWATCDLIVPQSFRACPAELPSKVREWLASPHPYTLRFGIGVLMRFYLDRAFFPEALDWVAAVRSQEYYGNMMAAWFFATALAKQYAAAIPYLEQHRLPAWTHNKTIQKALESRRIPPEQKAYLRTLERRPSC